MCLGIPGKILEIYDSQGLRMAAAALAGYRNAQGLETRVIPLEAIYDEFNGGLCEPEALRAFLAQAHSQWQLPPTYAVLAGNGTFDYRNLLAKNDNLVPPVMVMTLYGLTASDSDFGDLGGVDAPQIAVGRLPATNAVQLAGMIVKLQAYEALPLPATNQALLVADFADPQAGDFPAEILAVQGIVAPAFQTTTVSRRPRRTPRFRRPRATCRGGWAPTPPPWISTPRVRGSCTPWLRPLSS